MKANEIKVIIAEPMKEAYVKVIPNDLKALQSIVGGWIEVVTPFEDAACIIVNEEGKINRLQANRGLYDAKGELWDIVCGAMIITGDDLQEGEFVSLTDEQVEKYLHQFKYPEFFMMLDGEVKGFKLKEGEF